MGSLLIDSPDQGLSLTLAWPLLLLQVKAAAKFKKPPQDTSTGNLDDEERPALQRQNPGATSLVLQLLVRPWAENPSSWPVPHPRSSSASSLCSPVAGQSQDDFGVWPKHIFAPLLHENLPEKTLMCPRLVHRYWMQTGQAVSLPLPGHAQPLTPRIRHWEGHHTHTHPPPKPAGFPMLITSDRHRCLPLFAITTVSRQSCILEPQVPTL